MTEGSFVIRSAGQDDLAALLDLYQHLTPGDARASPEAARAIFTSFTADGQNRIFLGECDGELASSCTLVIIANLTRGGRPYALIENVVTHPGFRHRGLGRQLLAAATAAAWQAGCYKIMLMTGSRDPAVLDFYRRAGFEQSKTGFQKRRHPPRA